MMIKGCLLVSIPISNEYESKFGSKFDVLGIIGKSISLHNSAFFEQLSKSVYVLDASLR